MSLFGALVRTAVNTALLPVAVVKDVFTLGTEGFTAEQLRRLKEESEP